MSLVSAQSWPWNVGNSHCSTGWCDWLLQPVSNIASITQAFTRCVECLGALYQSPSSLRVCGVPQRCASWAGLQDAPGESTCQGTMTGIWSDGSSLLGMVSSGHSKVEPGASAVAGKLSASTFTLLQFYVWRERNVFHGTYLINHPYVHITLLIHTCLQSSNNCTTRSNTSIHQHWQSSTPPPAQQRPVPVRTLPTTFGWNHNHYMSDLKTSRLLDTVFITPFPLHCMINYICG